MIVAKTTFCIIPNVFTNSSASKKNIIFYDKRKFFNSNFFYSEKVH
jgi:hypothetical protein